MTNYAQGTGNTPLIIFRDGAQRTLEVAYAPASLFTNPVDDIYDFVPVNGITDVQMYLNNAGSYSYSPPPPPPPGPPAPQTLNFQIAIAQDPTIPPAAILCLASFAGAVAQTTYETLPILQTLWSLASEAYASPNGPLAGNCTDGTPVVTKIEAYATQFNCPLVAAVSQPPPPPPPPPNPPPGSAS